MIDSIIVGRGKRRIKIDLVRDKNQRRSVAGALKGHLFPTAAAHRAAKPEARA